VRLSWLHSAYSRPLFIPPGSGADYCDQLVCLSVCICLYARKHISGISGPIRTKFCTQIPVAVARSSSDGAALSYVLLVLWMTSRLAVMDARPARLGSTQRRRSITCATGAESDVYECLFDGDFDS